MSNKDKKIVNNHVRNQPFERSEDYFKKFKIYLYFAIAFATILTIIFVIGGVQVIVDKDANVSKGIGIMFIIFGILGTLVSIYFSYELRNIIVPFGNALNFDKRWYFIFGYSFSANVIGLIFIGISLAFRQMYNTRILLDKKTWNFEEYSKEKRYK